MKQAIGQNLSSLKSLLHRFLLIFENHEDSNILKTSISFDMADSCETYIF